MKQKILKLLVVLLVMALMVASILYYAIYVSPEKLTTKYDTVTSSKIPDSLDNVTIGFFSDIYYLEFMDHARLEKMVEEIKEAHVDILLFGGDLFSQPQSEDISAEDISALSELLDSLEAPLGKFYVLGDIDCTNEDTKTLVSNILFNAGFEELTNKSIKLHNRKMECINLIGLDNMINGSVDVQSAFSSISDESFNVVFTHTPDNVTTLPIETVDLALAGHSLGGQVRLPGIGASEVIVGSEKYSYGLYTYNGKTIRVSNGIGTSEVDMRLLCPPQFNVMVLRKK